MDAAKSDSTSMTLLGKIQVGDGAAWNRFTMLYGPMVRYWCKRWGVAAEDFDDVSQEVWMALGPNLSGFRPAPGQSFRAWLRGVTHHKSQDWHKRRSRQVAEARGGLDAAGELEQIKDRVDDFETVLPEEIAENHSLYRRALLLIQGEFEAKTWSAFVAATLETKTAAEVGAAHGMSAAAVRMARSRVIRRLREQLGDLLD